MSELAIETHDLTRTFRRRGRGDLTAVDRLSVTVAHGEAVGYIGANGAGKSTTIKLLCGILVPSSGGVRTCGLAPVPDRRRLAARIGVVFGQRTQLWWDLPVRESFDLLAAIHRMPTPTARTRIATLVDELDMSPFLATPVRQLSLGQRMRAEIAAALIHSPRLLVLDEPTIGLDVLSKQRLREFLIRERAERGTTLLLTTHDMGDVQRLCERILLVDHGHLAYDGTLAGLSARVGAGRVLVLDLDTPGPDLLGIPGARHLASEGDGLRQRLSYDASATSVGALLSAVGEVRGIRDVTVEEPDIEDVVRRIYRDFRTR